jgi:cytochrome P450
VDLQKPTIDFDHHSPEYKEHWREMLAGFRSDCPVGWSENYGGFWFVTKHEDVVRVFRDAATFSTLHNEPNDGVSYTGVLIPSWPGVQFPMEVDGPIHVESRHFLNPMFSPNSVKGLDERIAQFTDFCIDRAIESGTIDLVNDVANPVPALTTLEFLGLPLEEWDFYAPPFHGVVAYQQGSPEWEAAHANYLAVGHRLEEEIAKRRSQPIGDRLSTMLQMTVEGEPIEDNKLLAVVKLILAGGVDTSTNVLSVAFDYFDKHPEMREAVLSDAGLMDSACEEFLRVASSPQNFAHTATCPVDLAGQHIPAHERVMVSLASANHDETVFEDPDEIKIDRFPNRHVSFGRGAHRCIGSAIGRLQLRIVIAKVLKRLPDYELLPGAERYSTFGTMQGWIRMPAKFTPGESVGASLRPPTHASTTD